MSTPPTDPSPLVLSDDPRLRSELVTLTDADFLGGATGTATLARSGFLVTAYIVFKAPESWTSGARLLTLPEWARPAALFYVPPPYNNSGGRMVVYSNGAVNLYSPTTTTEARFTATWPAAS